LETTQTSEPKIAAQAPIGINHVVLNVQDIEASHRFWTEILGFKQVGALRPRGDGVKRRQMRFYSADHDGHLTHHDIALIERPDDRFDGPQRLDHVAIAMADRQSWLKQLAFLQSRGIAFTSRVDRGVTRGVHVADPNGHDVEILYELPRAAWEGDIDAALNYARPRPTQGDAALADNDAAPVFGAREAGHV
jgi:catechol 2,3-dioxygenase